MAFFFSLSVVTVFVYRMFLLYMCLVQQNSSESLLTIFIGFVSDFSLLLLVAAVVLSGLQLAKKIPQLNKLLNLLFFVGGMFWFVVHAINLRYFEHFKINFRVFHFNAVNVEGMNTLLVKMLLESNVSVVFLVATVLFSFLFWNLFSKDALASGFFYKPKNGLKLIGLFVLCNASVIFSRKFTGMNPELMYNMPYAVLYAYNHSRKFENDPYYSNKNPNSLSDIQQLMPNRDYANLSHYPLWQSNLVTGVTHRQERNSPSVWRGLSRFIGSGQKQSGPWNVIIVLSESLRAHDLYSFNKEGADPLLSPYMTKLFKESGVLFTEVFAAEEGTRFGQPAILCSLYSLSRGPSLMNTMPSNNLVCMSDLFNKKKYDTHFYYPSSNRFDNQDLFYKSHGVKKLHDEKDISKDSEKGGWGYSDHALFNHVLADLSEAHPPHFSTVLTLTNHGPLRIPSDVPKGVVDRERPVESQIIQYVDWAFVDFYKRLEKDYPHSIVILTADEGNHRGADGKIESLYDQIRKERRIPFVILSPKLPKHLAGSEVGQLSSNTDIAPTLLSLLGWAKTPQQFMGVNIFTRQDPVYLEWQGKPRQIEKQNGRVAVSPLGQKYSDILNFLSLSNRLAPPHYKDLISL